MFLAFLKLALLGTEQGPHWAASATQERELACTDCCSHSFHLTVFCECYLRRENLPVLFFALDRRLQTLTVLTASNILLFKYYSRNHAELRFLAPISCLLAVGHCSTPNSSISSPSNRNSKIRSSSFMDRHALVLQLRQEGESGVYYQQLLYSSARLQGHILNSLRLLLLQ